jgi:hypothetical protein
MRGLEPSLAVVQTTRNTASLTMEVVQARAFLSQSELSLSYYTIEALSAAITPDAKDKATLVQALRSTVDLAGKARTAEEVYSMNSLLKNLRQRVSLLYVLNDQEKEQWRVSISTSIKELEQSDPIALSSYGLVLSEIDDWDISNERILEEWRNPETSILRQQQLLFILLLTRPHDETCNLVEEYRRWLAISQLPAESARKKVFDKRLAVLGDFVRRGRLRLAFLQFLILTMQYIQLSYEITNWSPPEAYVLEDLLAVETPPKRIREIATVLSTRMPAEVHALLAKFASVLSDRFQQSASGYSYYTDEEKLLMEKRQQKFQTLSQRPAWKAKRDSILFSLTKLLTRPLKRFSANKVNTEE